MPTLTQAALEAVKVVTLENLVPLDVSAIREPAPVDVGAVIAENKITVASVSAPSAVSFVEAHTPVSVDDQFTEETLNRGYADAVVALSSLKTDINTKLTAFAEAVSARLADVGTGASAQTSEFNNKLADLRTAINAALDEIRTKEIRQSEDITAAVNTQLAAVYRNLTALQAGHDDSQAKLAALDDIFGADADAALKFAAINDFIATLRSTDLSFVAAVDATIDEVNSLRRIRQVQITLASASGVREVLCNESGVNFGEFVAASDYLVTAQVMDNPSVLAFISHKTKDGFRVSLKSNGVHFRPRPWDASTTPVDVVLTLTHNKRDPLTFGVNTLKDSFVTSGNGTDSSTVGA